MDMEKHPPRSKKKSTIERFEERSSSLFLVLLMCFATLVVLATGPGNLPAVWVWTSQTVWFSSTAVRKSELLCLGRVGIRTGLKPVVDWQCFSLSRATCSRI
jgi:succinate dehydrogenase hydrophobic anchor subunit